VYDMCISAAPMLHHDVLFARFKIKLPLNITKYAVVIYW